MDYKSIKEIYQKIWKYKEYQMYSPEVVYFDDIIKWVEKKPIHTILSLGCGEGYGMYKFYKKGYNIEGMDLDNFCKIPEIKNKIIIGDISDINNYNKNYDLIYSIDVLEHLPTNKLDKLFDAVSIRTKFFYFIISCQEDKLGKLIEEKLHLTVKPGYWWIQKISEYFDIESYWGNNTRIIIKGNTL